MKRKSQFPRRLSVIGRRGPFLHALGCAELTYQEVGSKGGSTVGQHCIFQADELKAR